MPPNHKSSAQQNQPPENSILVKLKKIIQVSENLQIEQLAKLLSMDKEQIYERIIDWALEFGFKIDQEILRFGSGDKNAFMAELDQAFTEWDRNEIDKSGKIYSTENSNKIHSKFLDKINTTRLIGRPNGRQSSEMGNQDHASLNEKAPPISLVKINEQSLLDQDSATTNIVDFRGVSLEKKQRDFLSAVEAMMGKSFSIDGKSNRPSRNFGGRHNLDNRFAVTITNNSIVWLKIQGQGLRSLPENIGDLTHLRQLHINYNPIVELPESIGKLQQLTELNVAFNNLIRLPESIGDLTNLRSLSAFSNRLRSLPRTLLAFKNKRVEILVWHNPIELSPEEKVLFSQMKIKIVWDNRIDINPSKFASMSDSEKREHVNRLNNEIDALQRRMGTEDLSRGRERETFLSIMYKLKEIYYLTPTLKLEKINS